MPEERRVSAWSAPVTATTLAAHVARHLTAVPATAADYQNLAVVFREARLSGYDPAEIEERTADTPFAPFIRYWSRQENRIEVWTMLSWVVPIILAVLAACAPNTAKEEVVTRVVEHVNERAQEPTTVVHIPASPSPQPGSEREPKRPE